MCTFAALGVAADGDTADRVLLDAPLDEFTPAYPNTLDVTSRPDISGPAVRILGVDLVQGNARITNGRLVGTRPLSLVCYWMPRAALSQSLPIEIALRDSGGRLSSEVRATVGATQGGSQWLPGCVYKQTYSIDLPAISRRFNGKTVLVVSLLPKARAGLQRIPLLRLSINVSPPLDSGRVPRPALEAAFGHDCRSLSASFRLGSGALQTLGVPAESSSGITSIGFVSAFSYGSVRQGDPVCEVRGLDGRGQECVWYLRSGIDTARTDYDFSPKTMNHEKVDVVESRDAEYLNAQDRPFQKHTFKGELKLPVDFGPLTALTFQAMTPYVFEVFDVVLIPASSGCSDE